MFTWGVLQQDHGQVPLTWESRGALGAASRVWAQGGDLSPAEIVCSSDSEPVGMGAVLALENWEELP